MPAYLGWSQNTSFSGQTVETLTTDQVSNTVEIPREKWGAADDEWGFGGFIITYGTPLVEPNSFHADSWYAWTGLRAGQRVTGGDDLAQLRNMWTEYHTEEGWPYKPSEVAGSLRWETDPSLATNVNAVTTTYAATKLPDGTTVRAPVPVETKLDMYMNHANLFAEGGDVDARGGAIDAPEFEFRMDVPPGTRWQHLIVTMDCPAWAEQQLVEPGEHKQHCGEVEFDWKTSDESAQTGDWRLPVRVTLPKGLYVPERVDVPGSASPQNTMPMTVMAIPQIRRDDVSSGRLSDVDPELIKVSLEGNVGEGDDRHITLMSRGRGGEMLVRELDPPPGYHSWELGDDGRLKDVSSSQGAAEIAVLGSGESSSASSDGEQSQPAAASTGTPTDSVDLAVNDAGRPVISSLVRDGVDLLDGYDITRVLTEAGPVTLGEHNRHGKVSLWEGNRHAPDPPDRDARAVYLTGDLFVGVRIFASTPAPMVLVESHSVAGHPVPHAVEGVADLATAPLVDVDTGEVRHPTRFLPPNSAPWRLVLQTPARHVSISNMFLQRGGEVFVRHGDGSEDLGELRDPQVVGVVNMLPVWTHGWEDGGLKLEDMITSGTAPAAGRFTESRSFRVVGVGEVPTGEDQACPPCRPVRDLANDLVFQETRDFDRHDTLALLFKGKRPDGSAIRAGDVSKLFISLFDEDGEYLFYGTLDGQHVYSREGGESWGFLLQTALPLPSEVQVFIRAMYDSGTAMLVRQPDDLVPPPDWELRFDRIPVTVTEAEDGRVEGITAPFAVVRLEVPEVGTVSETIAGPTGAFSASLDLGNAPSGDYEVIVDAVLSGTPDEAKRPSAAGFTVSTPLPGDKVGASTARIRHVAGQTGSVYRSDLAVDETAAKTFLASRESLGAYDESLRPTAWAVGALSDGVSPETPIYLRSLHASADRLVPSYAPDVDRPLLQDWAGSDGFAWRPGIPASAAATGLAVPSASALGIHAPIKPQAFLRMDGGAAAADNASVSSLEGTALLVLALKSNGDLPTFDPWWRNMVSDYLRRSQPSTPAESYARAAALGALGEGGSADISGESADSIAYRILLGAGSPGDLAPYQTIEGGLTLIRERGFAEAFPTALALAALRGTPP